MWQHTRSCISFQTPLKAILRMRKNSKISFCTFAESESSDQLLNSDSENNCREIEAQKCFKTTNGSLIMRRQNDWKLLQLKFYFCDVAEF